MNKVVRSIDFGGTVEKKTFLSRDEKLVKKQKEEEEEEDHQSVYYARVLGIRFWSPLYDDDTSFYALLYNTFRVTTRRRLPNVSVWVTTS